MFCLSDELKRRRFGYLDKVSNFSLVYESGESDNSIYPGRSMYSEHTVNNAIVLFYQRVGRLSM